MSFSFILSLAIFALLFYINDLRVELYRKDNQIKTLRIDRDQTIRLYEEVKNLFEFREGVWFGKSFTSKHRDFDLAIEKKMHL